jgi:uncharacterized protein YciI
MAYFALQYDVVPDHLTRRTPFRDAHLALAREAEARGELVMAGALADPLGALLIFTADDDTCVRAFVSADPYVTEGLVTRWQIRPWAVVLGAR